MPTPRRTRPLVRALLCAALLAVAPATALAAGGATPAFTPALLAGTWEGTWENQTFDTTGTANIVASAPGNTRLEFTVDFGGNVFGCDDPPPAKDGIPKGTGPNTWDGSGFRIKISGPLGSQAFTYDHAKRTLTGTGTDPTCLVGLDWSIAGTFSDREFSGTVTIKLPNGTPATSKLELTQTPAPAATTTAATTTAPGAGTTGQAADRVAPTVVIQGLTAKRTGPVALKWRAKDASGKATFVLTVAPLPAGAKPGTPAGTPVLTRTLRDRVVGTKQLTAFQETWAPGAAKAGSYRVCVRATDARGNRGAAACATLRLT
jgi:hypothetical protein